MNAALLLLSVCAGGANPVCCGSPCSDCNTVSHCSSCCGEREGFLARLRGKMKRCGSKGCCEVQCDHPGPIPGTEHPTLCQRVKDRICPCSPCASGCSSHYSFMPSGCMRMESECSSGTCGCSSKPCGLVNRMSAKFSSRKSCGGCSTSCSGCSNCSGYGSESSVIVNPSESIPGLPAKPKMPKADESRQIPRPLPPGTNKVERTETMPSAVILQPATPAQYTVPRTLDFGKSPY